MVFALGRARTRNGLFFGSYSTFFLQGCVENRVLKRGRGKLMERFPPKRGNLGPLRLCVCCPPPFLNPFLSLFLILLLFSPPSLLSPGCISGSAEHENFRPPKMPRSPDRPSTTTENFPEKQNQKRRLRLQIPFNFFITAQMRFHRI